MRELRDGTGAFIMLALSSMIGVVSMGFAVGGAGRGFLYLGAAFTAVAGTLTILLGAAYHRRRRLRRIVLSGRADWAGDCLVLEGDRVIPGEHKDILPPRPKGTLTLENGVFS